MFERWYASRPTPESAALLDQIGDAGRAESQAAAKRLVAIGELFIMRLRDSGEQADFAIDTWDAVAAQVSAALRCSLSMGSSYLRYAMAMRERLPEVGSLFQAGQIDYRSFQTIVSRTDLVTDAEALARVDALLAVRLSRYPKLTQGRLAAEVDRAVARADRDAVRRAKEAIKDRYVDVTTDAHMAYVTGNVLPAAGQAIDLRLNELAATVCDADPRTREQRRADALGALAAGAERLVCGCGSSDCAAAVPVHNRDVVIHVVADRSAVDGTSVGGTGVMFGADGLISAETVAELARHARLQPVVLPGDAPEPRYVPSAKLADFVRCRDLTCRAPGCDKPAFDCDLDHTVAYHDGGWTHASNLKALCRKHHLLKTFGGWRDTQLPDGTVIWQLPDGKTYVTTPGSAMLFPSLCAPTGDVPAPREGARGDYCGDRTAVMPRRRRTRAQNRARRIAVERRENHRAREAQAARSVAAEGPRQADNDHDPPPF